jgi:hypothetical protein
LDDILVRTVLPTDQWIAHVSTGTFPAYDGTSHQFDRIERVVPDMAGPWVDVTAASCLGKACDKDEKIIGFGSTRDSYKLQETSYATDLYCFDLLMSADRAKEQFAGIIDNLRDASIWISSNRARIEAFRVAGNKWSASQTMAPFTANWDATMTELTIASGSLPTSKLTGPMLKRRVQPLISKGYFGKSPQGAQMLIELVTDMDTVWDLVQGNTALHSNWRFENFESAAVQYYNLGWSGRIGNFALRADLFPMRFMQKVGSPGVLKRVFPYKAANATLGIKSEPDPQYDSAPYQISFIHHREAMRFLVRDASPVNPMMPFLNRDFMGKWHFVMDNLGVDRNGCVIENKRRNKGQFIADFSNATKAEHPEWEEAILHLREPGCVAEVNICANPASYVLQDLNSANAPCTTIFVFAAQPASNGHYIIAANGVRCNGNATTHTAIDTLNIGALVTALNTQVGALGTWAAVAGSTTSIQLSGATCKSVEIPFSL